MGSDLTEAPTEPPSDFRDDVLAKLARADWHRYPDRSQTVVLEKIASCYGISPDSILLTRGCTEALRVSFTAAAAEGFRLLLPAPSYFGFSLIAESLAAPHTFYSGADTVAVLRSAADVTPDSTLVICSPDNPTGEVRQNAEIETLAHLHRGGCIVDLTYDHFAQDPLHPHLADLLEAPVTACLSLSKCFGVAGARLGLLFGPPSALERYRHLVDPFPADYFQLAVLDSLFDDEWKSVREDLVHRVQRDRALVASLVPGILPGARLRELNGNFVSFHYPDDVQPDLIKELLRRTASKHFRHLSLVRLTVNGMTLSGLRAMKRK
ncbi:aminotransferase class I/II-fold pyridoxal phosphate-dependent enzyme [Streptomyces sp. DSM 44917]|uniref:Aminotransferase class I/II-fold pyridoxal phosphate-dependent enzyme n=1 Tax=Streptomyces boetiae TaxID=3075541 RepID=A0ABU2LFU1_9ACTN|nr:aminotransferase class I/II-fold pyridoxal phosphate-dependent enzyme [Streptomyces sp. DSM 44917]MDT0310441.1 aminotransferase class I/II-fold pyridoxal phosphate-dependent enzyme [Streptomyces sp. DSM 44917]